MNKKNSASNVKTLPKVTAAVATNGQNPFGSTIAFQTPKPQPKPPQTPKK